METIKQLEKKKLEIEEKIEALKNNDFIKVKNFRIYKWEDKEIREFVYPEGYRMAEFQEFTDLIDSGDIELEVWKYYWVKHFLKSQWDKEYCLSRVCLNRVGVVDAVVDGLSDSDGGGRVVCIKK